MDKLLEMLKLEALSEDVQREVKETLSTIIEAKATDLAEKKVEKMLDEEKEKLVETYEEKFESYKKDITEKFSNFVDTVLEEELQIPEKVYRYAHLGEVYNDLIEQFKMKLAIDEGKIDAEVKGILKEAKEELIKMKAECNNLIEGKLTLEKDAQKMAASLYLNQKCDGLTISQKRHMSNLLGDVVLKEEIDKKFAIIVESFNLLKEEDDKKDDDKKECPECGKMVDKDEKKCPECEASMSGPKKDKKDDKSMEEGKGHADVKTPLTEEKKEDETTPWAVQQKEWLRVMKKGL
jgi:hypothetical protein